MKEQRIEELRGAARKLIRELGMLELDPDNTQKTPGHWHILIEVARAPGITISEVGHLLLMSVSTMSRIIRSLIEGEFLTLKEGKDKREKSLFLTDKGQLEIQRINSFSASKIRGAFEFLTDEDVNQIIQAITQYGQALEKSRGMRESIKIVTLSTSRTIRKQIINMISHIQENEFSIPITDETNAGILKAEEEYYFNNSYNFWYAVNDEGKILGSIGLKKINNQHGEIKKLFVVKEYRGKGVAQKLLNTLLKAAVKHAFQFLTLGTVDKLHAAHKFYRKYGFTQIRRKDLPRGFEINPLDSLFFTMKIGENNGLENVQALEQLTEQEKKCVICYLKGMTAEDTGRKLFLSSRTVESHFEHIRDKLGLKSKRALFKYASHFLA